MVLVLQRGGETQYSYCKIIDTKMDQENVDNSSSNGVKTCGGSSSLISKRVTSAGALVRQQTTPSSSPTSVIAQSQQQQQEPASSMSEANLLLLDCVGKLRILDSPAIIYQRPELENCMASSRSPKPAIFNIDITANGAESVKTFNVSDYNELKARYASMESAYEADRQKTGILLAKKDAHISRLQERLTSLEHRLDAATQRTPDNIHGLIAERDALLDKVQRLEAAFAAEKTSWDTRLANAEREFREKEIIRKRSGELSSTTSNVDQTPQNSPSSLPSCTNCSYFRRELERIEKTLAELARDKEQLQQDNQRKETVLSELSAEATELRVQLNAFNDERTNLKRRIRQFEEDYARRSRNAEKRSMDPAVVVDENLLLRKRLNEAQDYFEAMDIESEQHITNLTNQLEDLHSALEQKQRDITLLHNRLKELEHERDTAQGKVKTSENNFSRQQDIIEGLRDDLDRQRDKNREMAKDRDDLLLRNATLSHEVEIVKREAQKQRDEIHEHLAEVSRELEQCKTKLREQETAAYDDVNAASKLISLNRKVTDLEEDLRERDATIRLQQQRLNELKKALQKEWKLALESAASFGSMPCGLDAVDSANGSFGITPLVPGSPDERLLLHFQYLKNVILRFVTSNEYEASQLVRAVAALLCLSPEEEQLVWDTLKWKMSWIPAAKPKLPQTQ